MTDKVKTNERATASFDTSVPYWPHSFFNFVDFMDDKYKWSVETFGPGARTEGVVNHIREELDEVLASPEDISEWADIIILAIDGARRMGFSADDIIEGLIAKHLKNKARKWPDWRQFTTGEAINHVRDQDSGC